MAQTPEMISQTAKIVQAIRTLGNGGVQTALSSVDDPLLGPIIEALNDVYLSRQKSPIENVISTSLLSTVLGAMPSLVSYVSSDLTYRYVNKGYTDWFGIPEAACIGKTMHQVLGDAAVTAVRPFIDRALAGERVEFQRELKYKSGGTRLVDVRYVPDFDPYGRVQGFIAIVSDLSELRDARAESASRDQDLRKVMDGVPAMIGYWNRDLNNLSANQNYLKSFGRTPEQIRGMHISELLGPEAYRRALGPIEAVLRGESPSFVNRVVDPNGESRAISVIYRPDFEGDEVVGFFSISTDITDQYETALRFEQMANNIDDVFWMTDPSKQIMVYISPGYEKIWGRTRESLYAHPWSFIEAIHDDDRSRILAAMEKQTRGDYDEEYRIVAADGSIRWIHDRAFPIKSADGQVSRVVGTAKDVTEKKLADAKIEEQKLFFGSILDTMNEAFIVGGDDLGIIHFNESACRILRGDPDQMIGRSPLDQSWNLIRENGTPLPIEEHPYVVTVRTGKSQTNIPIGMVSKKGKVTWLLVNTVPLKGVYEGKRIAVLMTFQDVTESRASARELAMSESRLREAQGVAQIGSWSFQLSTQKIEWTEEVFKLYEIDPSSGPPDFATMMAIHHPDDRELLMRCIEHCTRHATPYRIRLRLVFGDRMRWVEARGRPLKDANGDVVSLIGTTQDISSAVRLEEEKAYITASLSIGHWQFVPKTNELIWDQSMYALYGLDPRHFSGSFDAWASALTSETKAEALSALDLAIKGEKDFDLTFQIQKGDGSARWIGARAVVLRNEHGEALRAVGINWDRTKEVELERSLNLERAKSLQSAKLASLGEMAAGIAHEINNPLAIIAGAAGLLDRSAADPVKLKSRVNSIKKSVDRISKIISGLKKFSRSTEKRVLTEVRVSALLHEVLLLTASKASHENVRILTGFDKCQSALHCDEVEIEQVMVNLINNAVDAVAAQENSWVRVEAEDVESAVVVRIIDSGHGIPQSVREKIFDPFFTTKAAGKGTGLGLSITKGILDDHGASITILSDTPNTCFEIRFPKKVGAAHAS